MADYMNDNLSHPQHISTTLSAPTSSFNLHDEFAASRQEFEFDEDDEPSEPTAVNAKISLDNTYEIRRLLLSAFVPVVFFSNDDASTEALLWTLALPWMAFAAFKFGIPTLRPR